MTAKSGKPGDAPGSAVSTTTLSLVEGAPALTADGRIQLPDLTILKEEELANAIKEGCHRTEAIVHSARERNQAALMGAWCTGALLGEVHRRCEKSDTKWRDWMKRYCSKVPESTAYRWMNFFKKSSHVRIQEFSSLRQAYIEVGILKKAPPKEKTTPDLNTVPTATATDLVARVRKMREFYATVLGNFDITGLEQSARKDLANEIVALVTDLNEFVKRIGNGAMKPAKAVEIASKARRARK
jgi:hypothetical protein